MPNDSLQTFLKVFSRIPQRVVLKWEGEIPEDVPSNVMMVNWLPQQDLLGIKLVNSAHLIKVNNCKIECRTSKRQDFHNSRRDAGHSRSDLSRSSMPSHSAATKLKAHTTAQNKSWRKGNSSRMTAHGPLRSSSSRCRPALPFRWTVT